MNHNIQGVSVNKHLKECSDGKFSIRPIYKMNGEDKANRRQNKTLFIKMFKPELKNTTAWPK